MAYTSTIGFPDVEFIRTASEAAIERTREVSAAFAKRMEEATGRDARTLHRLLEWSPQQGGFITDHRRECHHVNGRTGKETIVDGQQGVVARSQRPNPWRPPK